MTFEAAALAALVISIVNLGACFYSLVKIIAMEKSTHNIYWKTPFEQPQVEAPTDEELNSKLNEELQAVMKSQATQEYLEKGFFKV